MNQIFNHLWQSAIFAGAVAFSCMMLRRNSPRLRYWMWLSASLKFLVPFSILVKTGARIQLPPDSPSLHAIAVQQISTYFAPVAVTATRATVSWTQVFAAIWLLGIVFLIIRRVRQWHTIHSAVRRAKPLPPGLSVPSYSSASMIEPGVFGVFRPVLLLPEGIADTLTSGQFEAVVAHELRHIRYRDNLTAALHMCVETLFWFHPVVWWIGARLMDERERDCDEAVLAQGSQPGVYARSLVKVCETYVESPLACASGIGGANLKRRIREIMTWRASLRLTFWAKAALAASAIAAVFIPFAIGIVRAQTLPPDPAESYEAVSIHKASPDETIHQIAPGPQGGWRVQNMSALSLMQVAYSVESYQIIGAPAWASSDCFDIVFTPDKTDNSPAGRMDRNAQRLRAVLRDRFGLISRVENREFPVYNLVQAKSGNKLVTHDPAKRSGRIGEDSSMLTGDGVGIAMLAKMLSGFVSRPVYDKTGLTGEYDFKLDWTPDAPPSDGFTTAPVGLDIFTALIDQLGLKLESTKGPVQVYVIEKIEHPTEN